MLVNGCNCYNVQIFSNLVIWHFIVSFRVVVSSECLHSSAIILAYTSLTDLYRRPLEVEEREFLVDLGVVTETQSNLGLVALSSQDVYQLMYEDYPSKFKEYMFLLEQRSHATSLQQMKEEAEALKQKVAMLCVFLLFVHVWFPLWWGISILYLEFWKPSSIDLYIYRLYVFINCIMWW